MSVQFDYHLVKNLYGGAAWMNRIKFSGLLISKLRVLHRNDLKSRVRNFLKYVSDISVCYCIRFNDRKCFVASHVVVCYLTFIFRVAQK